MRPYFYQPSGLLVVTTLFFSYCFASPLNSKLLPLVPAGAEIVAGFDSRTRDCGSGPLVLSTRNDTLDLDDWQALSGVDSKKVVDEVIEVAASSSTGRLSEHLLLVGGRFDKDRIFASAEQNGAERSEYEGATVLMIKPFAREQREMPGTRWLVILNNRIVLLGTPAMVQNALHRYASHADIDMPLMERLTLMRSDLSSWNILLGSESVEGSLVYTQPNSELTRLLNGADVLIVGARRGRTVRVDFSLRARSDHQSTFFDEKAASFTEVFAEDRRHESDSHGRSKTRLKSLSFEPDRIGGSVELSPKDFERWHQQGGFARRFQPSTVVAGHGEYGR